MHYLIGEAGVRWMFEKREYILGGITELTVDHHQVQGISQSGRTTFQITHKKSWISQPLSTCSHPALVKCLLHAYKPPHTSGLHVCVGWGAGPTASPHSAGTSELLGGRQVLSSCACVTLITSVEVAQNPYRNGHWDYSVAGTETPLFSHATIHTPVSVLSLGPQRLRQHFCPRRNFIIAWKHTFKN